MLANGQPAICIERVRELDSLDRDAVFPSNLDWHHIPEIGFCSYLLLMSR